MSVEKQKSTIIKDTLILFAITLVAALLLGTVYEITKEPIANAALEAKTAAYKSVFPALDSTSENEELSALVEESDAMLSKYPDLIGSEIEEALLALDASGKPLGIVMTVKNSKGYGGAIEFTIGVGSDGTMYGLEFLSISETAGLGMKAKKEEFKNQFKGVKVSQFAFAKRGIMGDVDIDAISSASITTSAITRGVNAGLKFAAEAFEKKVGGIGDE